MTASVAVATTALGLRGAFLGVQVLVARSLGEEAFAYYVAVVIGGAMTIAIGDLGLRNSLVFEFASDPTGAAAALRRPLAARAVLLTVTCVAIGLSVDAVVAGAAGGPGVAVLLTYAYGLESLSRCARVPLRVAGDIPREMRIEAAGRGLFVVGLTLGVLVDGLTGAALGGLTGAGAAFWYSKKVVARRFHAPAAPGALAFSPRHLVFAGVTLVATLYGRADYFIVAGTRGANEAAQYGAVYALVSGFMVLSTAAVEASLGRLGRESPTTRAWLGRTTWAVGVGGGVSIAAFGPLAADLVFGVPRDNLTLVCLLLGASFVLMTRNGRLLVTAPLEGQQRHLLIVMAIAMTVNLAGGLVLIPRHGIVSAAAMTLLAEGVLAAIAHVRLGQEDHALPTT